ncbi:transposase [Diaminobutyricibacter sp. McL0608]|uniref:transposase n=1 Tax=Leifsonia sp. McL0608 TaxID=3143537 RepID=UPI0031F2E812
MPGVGVGTCARLLAEISGRHFDTAAHLAAYAGLACNSACVRYGRFLGRIRGSRMPSAGLRLRRPSRTAYFRIIENTRWYERTVRAPTRLFSSEIHDWVSACVMPFSGVDPHCGSAARA